MKINAKLNTSESFKNAPGLGAEVQTSGLGLVSVYDSRNSNFWPSKGNWLELNATGLDVAYAEGGNVSVYFQVGDWLAN